jgi:hypothetical protein
VTGGQQPGHGQDVPEAAVDWLARTLLFQGIGLEWSEAPEAARADFRETAHDLLITLAPLIGQAHAARELEAWASALRRVQDNPRVRQVPLIASTVGDVAAGMEHRARELRGGHDGSGT